VHGGFTLDDFTVDEEQGTVTCPAGQVRPMSKSRAVTFGAACAACPLRARCTTAKDDRSMTIHPHDRLLRTARAQVRTEAFKQAYPTRSAIERIIAWTATQNGRRVRLRYIGAEKNDAWLHNRCAAINLRTLLRHGLARRDGAWVLADRTAPAAKPRRPLAPASAGPAEPLPATSLAGGGVFRVPVPDQPATRPSTGSGIFRGVLGQPAGARDADAVPWPIRSAARRDRDTTAVTPAGQGGFPG
jgi:Transposase DDE domain